MEDWWDYYNGKIEKVTSEENNLHFFYHDSRMESSGTEFETARWKSGARLPVDVPGILKNKAVL
jgi:hypothetical protein